MKKSISYFKSLMLAVFAMAVFFPVASYAQVVFDGTTDAISLVDFLGQTANMTNIIVGVVGTVLTEIVVKVSPSSKTMNWIRSIVIGVSVAIIGFKIGIPKIKITDVGYFMSFFYFAYKFIFTGEVTDPTKG